MARFLRNAIMKIKDPLRVYTRWTPEERMVQETCERYCQEVLKPTIKKNFQEHRSHPTLLKDLGELGLLGMTSQPDPLSYTSYGIAAREIEAVDSAYRSSLSVQSSLVIYPINKFGTDYVKDRYLPGLFSGTSVGAFGLTEPMHGSDPGSMRTNAIKDSDGSYVLNGEKMWITNAPLADTFVVWAKDKSNDDKITGFVLDRDDKGLSTPTIHDKLSLNASCTGQIVMEDVRIGPERKLEVLGLKGPFSCLNMARFGISWGVLGAAADSLQEALEYADTRVQFGKSLTEFQLVQKKIADQTSKIGIALSACQQVSELMQTDQHDPAMISILKGQNCQLALETAQISRDIFGGNGIVDDYSPIRHLMNMQSVCTYEGTTDIHSLIIGRAVTGAQAFH